MACFDFFHENIAHTITVPLNPSHLSPSLLFLLPSLILSSLRCRLEHNNAGGLGGALYYESCIKLNRRCFVQGIGPLSGSRAILLRNNRARAGGAVFVECSEIGSLCAAAFDTTNLIGALPHLPKVEFTGSRASMYGDTIATQPASTRWYERSPDAVKIVPSRASQCTNEAAQSSTSAYQQLVAAVQPRDSFGSLARGLATHSQKYSTQ